VAGRYYTGSDPALDQGRKLEQSQSVGNLRPGTTDPICELLMSGAEILKQLLIGSRLLQRIELTTMQVFEKSVA
jgi:hypothetical protein